VVLEAATADVSRDEVTAAYFGVREETIRHAHEHADAGAAGAAEAAGASTTPPGPGTPAE
jgi:hypothetical protein